MLRRRSHHQFAERRRAVGPEKPLSGAVQHVGKNAWLAGGCCTYAISRTLGGRIAAWLVSPERLGYYVGRISGTASILTILLFQIALPSETPGAVYLGDSFVHGNYALLLAIGAAGVAASVVTIRALQRKAHE